jgi:hypothetical protein
MLVQAAKQPAGEVIAEFGQSRDPLPQLGFVNESVVYRHDQLKASDLVPCINANLHGERLFS